jgi:hypothetical protein
LHLKHPFPQILKVVLKGLLDAPFSFESSRSEGTKLVDESFHFLVRTLSDPLRHGIPKSRTLPTAMHVKERGKAVPGFLEDFLREIRLSVCRIANQSDPVTLEQSAPPRRPCVQFFVQRFSEKQFVELILQLIRQSHPSLMSALGTEETARCGLLRFHHKLFRFRFL